MARAKVICSLLAFSGATAFGQPLVQFANNAALNAGIVLSAGTHLMRVGIVVSFHYVTGPVQFNSEVRIQRNMRTLGPPVRHSEIALSQGIVAGIGPRDEPPGLIRHLVSNQTGARFFVAYAYTAWFNRIGTTQQTGLIAAGARSLTLISANDLYARPTLDRFRSGGLQARYRCSPESEASVVCAIWTGDYRKKRKVDTIPAFRNHCYMDTTGGRYTRFSHGILAAEFSYLLPYAQLARAGAGVDAEQVRNAIQNRLVHNLRFIPKKWIRNQNCHLPMLDVEGNPYLYQPSQTIRKPRGYFDLSANPALMY